MTDSPKRRVHIAAAQAEIDDERLAARQAPGADESIEGGVGVEPVAQVQATTPPTTAPIIEPTTAPRTGPMSSKLSARVLAVKPSATLAITGLFAFLITFADAAFSRFRSSVL